MDDERLKRLGGGNYFDELLARIRDIRSSKKGILSYSSSRFRTKYIGLLINTLQQKLSTSVPMPKRKIWGLLHGAAILSAALV